MALRTFLCPDCDGHGCFAPEFGRDPADTVECEDCNGSGVVKMTRDEGDRLDLHPWTGDEGRNIQRRVHHATPDPLLALAKHRSNLKPFSPPVYGIRFYYDAARVRAMRPVVLPKPTTARAWSLAA